MASGGVVRGGSRERGWAGLGGAGGGGSGAAGVPAIEGVGDVVGVVVAAGWGSVGTREGPRRALRRLRAPSRGASVGEAESGPRGLRSRGVAGMAAGATS